MEEGAATFGESPMTQQSDMPLEGHCYPAGVHPWLGAVLIFTALVVSGVMKFGLSLL